MTKNLFLQNKYSKCYFRIIEKAKSRKLNDIYVERHHILPKSLGGTDNCENLVLLTAREHFICHLLLIKLVRPEYKKKMNYAYWRMCNSSGQRYKPSSRFYELGKRLFIESQAGHAPYNLSQSDESRKKISTGMKRRLSELSDQEMKDRMYKSCCNPSVYTEERAAKISKSTTGVKKTKTPRLLRAEQDRKERCTATLIKCGHSHRGRTWKIVDGNRVWMDKGAQNH